MTALELAHERVLAEKQLTVRPDDSKIRSAMQIAERKLELIFDVHRIPSHPQLPDKLIAPCLMPFKRKKPPTALQRREDLEPGARTGTSLYLSSAGYNTNFGSISSLILRDELNGTTLFRPISP